MYRRLKNILGVSLIILAIVLSQLPMEAVRADEESSESRTTQETSGSEPTAEETPSEEASSEDISALAEDTPAGDADAAADPPTDTYTVTFDYGFIGLNPTLETLDVLQGNLIPGDTKWTIQGDKGLTPNSDYTIDGVSYKFLGWYKDIACSVPWELSANTVQENMALYAGWKCSDDRVVKITYSADDATSDKKQEISVPAGKRLGTQKPTEPHKDGSTFSMWVDDKNAEINWNLIPTKPMTFVAKFETREFTVTFHANQGKFDDGASVKEVKVLNDKEIEASQYPSIDADSFSGYQVEEDTWYTDKECLTLFKKDKKITENITLYKKWTKTTEKGFVINPEGTVLYGFDGTQEEVEIPSTVRFIATGAFDEGDMKNMKKITLPSGITNVLGNAFPANDKVNHEIEIYASKDGSETSVKWGQTLAERYGYFKYVPTGGSGGDTSADSVILEDTICNLHKVNLGSGNNPYFHKPDVTLPITSLTNGRYTVIFTELNEPKTIKGLLQKQGYTVDGDLAYYMDITLKKAGEQQGYIPVWGAPGMKIRMALPFSWYGRDIGKIKLFMINTSGAEMSLLEVPLTDFAHNMFTYTLPYSTTVPEYALVYTGKLDEGSTGGGNNNGGSTGGGDNTGGNNGNTGGGNGGGSSSGGGGSSGGSGSSSGSSSGGGDNTGGNNGSTVAPGGVAPIAPPPTPGTPGGIVPPELVTPAPTPGGGAPSVGGGSTGGGGGQPSHVKDSTPKTGDPLEYRSILVCSFFSVGVLLLLIGNKKKSSSSVPSLRG